MTLLGVAAAGVLLWLASQWEADGNAEYWTQMGLVAAAGLVMALSQLFGGWTKWGLPRISAGVFLLGFLPALVAGGLVLLDAQPDGGWGSGFAGDLGLSSLVEDLAGVLPAIAFLIGLTFGFVFDTTGPRVDDDVEVVEEHRTAYPVDRAATDAPVTAERRAVVHDDDTVVDRERDVWVDRDRGGAVEGDRDDYVDRDRDGYVDRDTDVVAGDRDGHEHGRRGLFRR
jgi:hypothetical protein